MIAKLKTCLSVWEAGLSQILNSGHKLIAESLARWQDFLWYRSLINVRRIQPSVVASLEVYFLKTLFLKFFFLEKVLPQIDVQLLRNTLIKSPVDLRLQISMHISYSLYQRV